MIEVIRNIRKRARVRIKENLVLLVGSALIVLLSASIALMGCPELDWCLLNMTAIR